MLSSVSERGRQRLQSAIRASGASNQTLCEQLKAQLRASGIAHRRTEEERAEAFFPLRATTTAADRKRDARAAKGTAQLSGRLEIERRGCSCWSHPSDDVLWAARAAIFGGVDLPGAVRRRAIDGLAKVGHL